MPVGLPDQARKVDSSIEKSKARLVLFYTAVCLALDSEDPFRTGVVARHLLTGGKANKFSSRLGTSCALRLGNRILRFQRCISERQVREQDGEIYMQSPPRCEGQGPDEPEVK